MRSRLTSDARNTEIDGDTAGVARSGSVERGGTDIQSQVASVLNHSAQGTISFNKYMSIYIHEKIRGKK